MTPSTLRMVPYRDEMEERVRELVTSGLVERWGFNDSSQNPDLQNIAQYYRDDELFVALCDKEIVGAGAIVRESAGVGRIVRMSVSRACRGQGIGKAILRHLEEVGISKGYHTIVIETTESWEDAIAFYRSQGYGILRYADGEVHFTKRSGSLKTSKGKERPLA